MRKKVKWRTERELSTDGSRSYPVELPECPHCGGYPTYNEDPCPYCGGELDYGKEVEPYVHRKGVRPIDGNFLKEVLLLWLDDPEQAGLIDKFTLEAVLRAIDILPTITAVKE